MCGANQQQQQISDAQQQMYQTLNSSYQTAFGQSQAITNALTAQFQPILAAGPGQQGFSAGENQSLNTSAAENIAQNYAAAQKATAQVLAARGGGNTLLPDSTSANLIAQNANLAAQQRSQAQNTITQANYAQGYQNWGQAANVLTSTAGLLNPNAYAGSATGAGTAAANTANQIAQANNSVWNAAIGALGSVGGAALGNPSGIMSMFGSKPSIDTNAISWANPANYVNPISSGTGYQGLMLPSLSGTGTVPYASAGGY
jgi:hypothetical protein